MGFLFPREKLQEINSIFCIHGKCKKRTQIIYTKNQKEKISYLISLPALPARDSHSQPGAPPPPRCSSASPLHVTSHIHTVCPRRILSLSCLSSPPRRRSARPPSAAASPRFLSSLLQAAAVAPRCTWPSRAAAGSRPARSGASRSAEATRSAAAGSRRPTWTRRPRRRARRSGKGSRWGSRCRRSPCRSCRTRRRPTSGRGLSGRPLASSCSTCGRSASSSASLLVVSLWPPTTMGRQISETRRLTRNPNHRSSLRSQNHQALMCLKAIQLRSRQLLSRRHEGESIEAIAAYRALRLQ